MRRCLLPLAVLLLAASAPLAQAQTLLPAFSLAADPTSASVLPGETATFTITVANSVPAQRNAAFAATNLPAEWNASFSPLGVIVPASGNNTTVLSVVVPASQAPGGPFPFTVEANDGFGAITRMNVSVSVKPRPEPTPTPTPQPPTLNLAIASGDAGASGETVQGALTLSHSDATRDSLSVELSLAGDAAWQPHLLASDRFRVLDRDRPVSIPLYVVVPQLAENTTRTFTLTAKADGYSFTAAWTVLGIAPPPLAGGQDAATGGASTSSPSASPTRAAPTPALEVLVAPLEIPIAPGESAQGAFTLRNTGPLPLRLALQGRAPVSWDPVAWSTSTIDLAPGEARDVPFTITAPDGLPLGGEATGQLTASGDGVLRTTQFHLKIVAPSTPRDTTTAAVEVPVAPDGALPSAGVPVTLVLGLGMVGAGAAALVHRPTREKLVWVGVGLYTRLARPDVLGHEERERLYKLVESQPGIHFHALQRDLAWNTGTLTYHLRVLEKHGFLVSRRDGLYRRFYLSGAAPRKETFENAGPTGLRADVLEAVKNTPGISQSDLALALGANKQTVNYHVKALERAGTIRVEKRGRDTYLYPGSSPHQGPGYAQA